jgi:predicted RNase H-like HicB family nuclease
MGRRAKLLDKILRGTSTKYEIIIYWSNEDEAYIAEVPELPSCAADGQTYGEAIANAEIVIREWIETTKGIESPYSRAERPPHLCLKHQTAKVYGRNPSQDS